jgi:hypothetical protein
MIKADLPFGPRTAEMLMKIASHPISNAKHASLLPSSWSTVHELTKLPAETFEQAMASGVINPTTTRADVVKLRVPVTSKTLRIKSVGYLTQDDDERPPVRVPKATGPIPLLLFEKLQELDRLIADIETVMLQRDDTKAAERRITASADRLLSIAKLVKQKNVSADVG